jgi:hypothetical protein
MPEVHRKVVSLRNIKKERIDYEERETIDIDIE